MDVCTRSLKEIMPVEEGWESLISAPCEDGDNVISEIFFEYSRRLRDPVFSPKKTSSELTVSKIEESEEEKRRTSLLRTVLRDTYMKYTILGNDKKVEATAEARELLDNNEALFDDVIQMFHAGFNPYWKLTPCLYQYEVDAKKEKVSLENMPEGQYENVLLCWDRYPLLRYRLVYQMNLQKQGQYQKSVGDGLSLRESRLLFVKAQKTAYKALNPNDADFHKKVYYYTLLRHHPRLINKIRLLWNLFSGEDKKLSPAISANNLCQRLVSEEGDEIVAILDQIRTTSGEKLFPNFVEAEKLLSSQLMCSRKCERVVISEGLLEDTAKALLLPWKVPPLPLNTVNRLIPHVIDHLAAVFRKDTDSLAQKLSQLAQVIYKITQSEKGFLCAATQLAFRINSTVGNIIVSAGKGKRLNIWEHFINGKVTPRELSAMVFDLNMECVRLYRRLSPEDLNKKVPHFLTETETEIGGPSEPSVDLKKKRLSLRLDKLKTTDRIKESEDSSSVEERSGEIEATEGEMVKTPYTLSNLFNLLSLMVVYSIVTSKNDKEAVKAARNCIKLSEELLKPPVINAHLAYAILAGFNNISVSRLKTAVLDKLGKKHLESLKRLETLFDERHNFKNYKNFLRKSRFPVIPYLGMITREFTFASEIDISEEQKSIVKRMYDEFCKTLTLLKVSVPIKGERTDCLEFLYNSEKVLEVPPPYLINDFSGPRELKPEEWEEMELDDQLYHCSSQKWPTPRND